MELWIKIVLVILVAVAAAFVQRVSGFGFGIFAMIFLPYLVESYGSATLLSTLMSISASVYVAVAARKDIKWRLIIPCLIASVVTTSLAVVFMKTQSNDFLKMLLGIFLIILSAYFMFFSSKIKIKSNVSTGVGAGMLSGVMGGLFAMGGPPIVIYLLSATSSTAVYLACIQAYFALSNVYSIGVKVAAGFFTLDVLLLAVCGMAGVFLGTALGARVYKKLDSDKIKKVVYTVMLVSGIITVVMSSGLLK